jgi:hypothetical protein
VNEQPEGSGWILFAGIMILIAGVLNVIYGIAAIDNSSFFAGHTEFIFSSLKTWGWIILILGIFEIFAAFSIWRGGAFGAVLGIFAASLSAIGALLSIPAYPFWSLAIFAVDILVIYGLAAYGARGRTTA